MLERRDLVQLDTELREAWGIEVGSLECPDWWASLEDECPPGLVNRFVEVHRAYVESEVNGGPESRMAERAFFDLVADERLLGRVHAHRRPVIVDIAAFVDELVMDRGITGPVLDAGCHAGYLSAWWARHAELELVGSDLSLAALELGRRRCAALGRSVELVEADLLPGAERREFRMIVAVDVLPEEIESGLEGLQRLAHGLADDGYLVLSTGHPLDVAWQPLERVFKTLGELGLGFVQAGCLGGVVAPGLEPWGQSVFVLRRGEATALRREHIAESHRDWPGFLDFAADPSVPVQEKSVAWFRARLR